MIDTVNMFIKRIGQFPRREIVLAAIILLGCLGSYISVQSLIWVGMITGVACALLFVMNNDDFARKSRLLALIHGYSPHDDVEHIERSLSHTIALSLYAALGSACTFFVRGVRGLSGIDPYTSWSLLDIPEYWFSSEGTNVYNKTHIRQGLGEVFFFFTCLLILFLLCERAYRRFSSVNSRADFHPATPIFLFAALVAVGRFPPYQINLLHWTVWIGPGLGVMHGEWPMLHVPSGYGFLPAGILAIVIDLFSVSPFVLYGLVAAATVLASVALYALMSGISGSKYIAVIMTIILLFGFENPITSLEVPNSGPFRFEFMQGVSLLMAWYVLSNNNVKALVAGVGFGIIVLWDPLFQGFVAIPLVAALLYRKIVSADPMAIKKIASVVISSSIVLIAIVVFSNGFPRDGIPGIIHRMNGFGKLFYEGAGGLPQNLTYPDIIWLGSFALGITLLVHKILERQTIGTDGLFLAVALVYSLPVILYHISRTSWIGENALAWVMLPVTLLIARVIWGEDSRKTYQIAVLGLAMSLIVSQNVVSEIAHRGNTLLFSYEDKRANWSYECALLVRAGTPCKQPWPDPYEDLRKSFHEPLIKTNGLYNGTLVSLCKKDIPFLSSVDSFIYLYGDCRAQFHFVPPGTSYRGIPDFEIYRDYLLQYDLVAIDWRNAATQTPFWREVERQLIDNGYCPTPIGDGRIMVYQRGYRSSTRSSLRATK